jgi:hypothetical protein
MKNILRFIMSLAAVSVLLFAGGGQTFALQTTDSANGASVSEDRALGTCSDNYGSSTNIKVVSYPCNEAVRPRYELYAAIVIFVVVLITVVILVRVKKRRNVKQ